MAQYIVPIAMFCLALGQGQAMSASMQENAGYIAEQLITDDTPDQVHSNIVKNYAPKLTKALSEKSVTVTDPDALVDALRNHIAAPSLETLQNRASEILVETRDPMELQTWANLLRIAGSGTFDTKGETALTKLAKNPETSEDATRLGFAIISAMFKIVLERSSPKVDLTAPYIIEMLTTEHEVFNFSNRIAQRTLIQDLRKGAATDSPSRLPQIRQ